MATHDHDHEHADADAQHDHDPEGHAHGIGGHQHAPANFGKAFAIGIALNLAYVLGEAFYGVASHSLALLADAGHNLGDVLGLAGAWLASVLSRRPPSGRFTYGLRGSSILAALGNAVILLVVTGGIAWEGIRRLMHPEPTVGYTIMAVAAVGILVNGVTAYLFMAGRKDDLNIKGAFLHMASDALVALGVVIAGAVILWTGWLWLDPAISLMISAVIVVGTWSLLRDSVSLSLDAVPPGLDKDEVEAFLRGLPGVTEIHDLHIWGMSTTETALTAHLVRPAAAVDDDLLRHACDELKKRFKIGHATFQVEDGRGAHPCVLKPDEVV
ncbi:MAG: cation diffusion facilitator family transporter [Pseudomonadota bacterium]|nr:cation diffusion facilitator family transporter [Pseudomonadota bacterium]